MGSTQKPWNFGLNKRQDARLQMAAEKASETMKARGGSLLSESTKRKLSESMKRAHAEGRAWNIGMSRWNNRPSYPEEFFMKVIDNEFLDKNYVREYPLGKFSLDFAWVDKKLAIEIDGDHHERFEEQKRRDREKDLLAESQGWKILRLRWKDVCNDTKGKIREAVEFISDPDNPSSVHGPAC